MPATDESTLALAAQLRALSDHELSALLTARDVRGSSIKDFFDLADALLDPDSIQNALGRLDRTALITIGALGTSTVPLSAQDAAALVSEWGAEPAAVAQHLAAATEIAIVTHADGHYAVPPSVSRQLEQWPTLGLPGLDELASTPPPAALVPVSQTEVRVTDAGSAEHAFATSTSIAELISELQHESARELARGGVALPDSKRLAASMSVDIERVPELLEIASRAGLVALDSGRWMPTSASASWLSGTSGERWARLAAAWLQRLPRDIREILGHRAHAVWGEQLQNYVDWLFPAGGERMHERVLVYTRDAQLLGITSEHVPSTPGTALITEGPVQAAAAMVALFPAEVTQVYLQHDLSIVSPGPLAPRIDARLRTIADVEGRALASSYRVSTASIYRAMAGGETVSTIRRFLSEISLTGIPQPLEYLLAEAGSRYGLVRVAAVDGGRASVRSTDDAMLRTLLVDHGISALGLTRAGDGLISRFNQDIVFWTLSEARYPVTAENSDGEVIVLKRPTASRSNTSESVDTTASLIERLRLGSSSDPDVTGAAWLTRQLDVAIKGKVTITVTVQLGDGSTANYQLEPASVAGGRLRALDRKADIERTLPLARILSVSPAK
ncbi:helicase-associated domain-containing protein [Salinibacterium sp. G-O1]|uniref:helicase-associated domain-containing protein n=1 Tax=Salinibacterium sp. G-O1 TaxID=3046208 RepID=UPI0024B9876E|nr:helicase-associated domain-containing protein [Salinibacterium sp. G-O1]MDJ0336071.1 helicase-associated domain-containing protein [Salinibacterium sp. G-O1]